MKRQMARAGGLVLLVCSLGAGCSGETDSFGDDGLGADEEDEIGSTVDNASTTKCEIRVEADGCPRVPSAQFPKRTWFADSFEGANSNNGRCLRRAMDWHWYCGFGNGPIVRARFFVNNQVVSQQISRGPAFGLRTFGWAGSELPTVGGTHCQTFINAASCPKYPGAVPMKVWFDDTWEGANDNHGRRMQRARDWHWWCGIPEGNAVHSRFMLNGTVISTLVTTGPKSSVIYGLGGSRLPIN